MAFITYKTVVQKVADACSAHEYIASFNHGSIDFLDASSQDITYPYVFLRPLQSSGYSQDTRLMVRTFELYALDTPRLSNESPLDVLSRMETTILDIGAYFNWGPPSDDQTQGFSLDFQSIIPTLEAFGDRCYGFVGNITISTMGTYSYCNFPD